MSERPYHKSLRLENFTAFADASLEFVPGVNVFVGENGTGKSHAMKLLYAAHRALYQPGQITATYFGRLFQVELPIELVRLGRTPSTSTIRGEFGGAQWTFQVAVSGVFLEFKPPNAGNSPRSVFVPSMDMMGHSKGFLAANNEIVLDFVQTCIDVVSLLSLVRQNNSEPVPAYDTLKRLLGGDLELDDSTGRFYLTSPVGRMAMPLVAEGIRKIATLVRLYQNGWLAPGSTLFWDEPEVNLNPKVMDEVIGALLELARSGVQIFLATHSYVILKELDLQAGRADNVRYFAFQRGDSGTVVNPTDDFALLEPNPILDQYDSLYDRDLTRATGRNRHGEPVR